MPRSSLSDGAAARLLPPVAPQRGWNVVDGVIRFKTSEKEALTSKDIPAMPLIGQTLAYARELERIV